MALVAAGFSIAGATSVTAAVQPASVASIAHVAVPPGQSGASSGAGYLTVTNNGTTPDRLSCTSSDAAGGCQIHSMTMDNGVMKMRPVENGLEIKPGETVTLKPGGYHLMFVDLKHPLEQGSAVEATLQFEKAGPVKIEFPTLALGAAAPGANVGGGNMMQGGGMMQQLDKH